VAPDLASTVFATAGLRVVLGGGVPAAAKKLPYEGTAVDPAGCGVPRPELDPLAAMELGLGVGALY